MAKDWYNPRAAKAVRTVREARAAEQWRRLKGRGRPALPLGACLLYPLSDGPGVALLIVFSAVLWVLTLPVFDVLAILEPLTRGNWALGLLALPVLSPLILTFGVMSGYVLLILGQLLVASAFGEAEHPRWPEWNTEAIAEGLGRWLWAGLFGLVLGGFPAMYYWVHCGQVDWFDRLMFAELVILGAGYAQMALAASLLHENLLAANPFTVLQAIYRVGWDYLIPCVVSGVALLLAGGALWVVLFRMPSQSAALVAFWGFWVFVLYEAMVVLRVLGLTYQSHAEDLAWFRKRPRWATPSRFGRIYSNS